MVVEKGILRVRRKNNQISFQVQMGDQPAMNVAQGEVSQTLIEQPSTFENQEVEFERAAGQPKQVREPGGTFVPPRSSAGAAHSRTTGSRTGNRQQDRRQPSPSRSNHQQQPNRSNSNQQPNRSERSSSRGDSSQRPQSNRSDSRRSEQMPCFNNPYNFVPAPPRDTHHPELGDHQSVAQDTFEPDRYTGRIRVCMEVKTPLLVPDVEKMTEQTNGHKLLPLLVDSEGKPVILASSVRGMLRTAYEIVTNSRFGRFSPKLKNRQAFRMVTSDALQLIPARIENDQIHLFTGTSQIGDSGKPANNGLMYAAWLRRYHRGKLSPSQLDYTSKQHLKDGDKVFCWIEKWQIHYWDDEQKTHVPDTWYWSICKIACSQAELGEKPKNTVAKKAQEKQPWYEPLPGSIKQVSGWIYTENPDKNNSSKRVLFVDCEEIQHGDEVYCWIEKFQHHRWDRHKNQHVPDFQYASVRKIASSVEDLGDAPPPTQSPTPRDRQSWHEPFGAPMKQIRGWVCITNANINRKHDERVFFLDSATGNPPLGPFPVDDEHRGMWRELISNYQDIHEDELNKRKGRKQQPDAYWGDEPGKTAWSRHVYTKSEQELQDGTLCYVRLNKAQTQVEALFPVMISRELYDVAPWDLLDDSLRPASKIQELSPADRVFGWVCADADGNSQNSKTSVAARGLLRVGPIQCDSSVQDTIECFHGEGVPLAILAAPKPQQSRFYVAESLHGEAQQDGLSKKDAGYSDGKGLRGRKVYPHQRSLPSQHWDNPMQDRTQDGVGQPRHYQEYRRPRKKGEEQRNDQNRSILGWIKPDAKFSFDLHVHNLSKVELGALLWLLSLPDDAYFRLGGGKPLGFGSVRLSLDKSNTDVCTGTTLRSRYAQWHTTSTENADTYKTVEDFKEALSQVFGEMEFAEIPLVKAFLTACRGYENNAPIHYPRVAPNNIPGPPHPDGKSFEWFVQNERDQHRCYALPDLASNKGLPFLPPRER